MPGEWDTTGCRGEDPAMLLGDGGEMSEINPVSPVIRLPYIGYQLSGRLATKGIDTVGDLVRYFMREPHPYTVAELHLRLSRLLRNYRKNRCVDWGANKRYQVSDVNQCAFNSVAKTLAHVHMYWPAHFSIPNAEDLEYRFRGDTSEVRQCACARTAGECNGLLEGGCRWTAANHTRMGLGACTPRNSTDTGFVGNSVNDRYDQHSRRVKDRTARVQVINSDQGPLHYVRGWRVPTPPADAAPRPNTRINITQPVGVRLRRRRRRRSKRIRDRGERPTQLRAGGEAALHSCGTGGSSSSNISPTLPDPSWSEETSRRWARAIVNRFA